MRGAEDGRRRTEDGGRRTEVGGGRRRTEDGDEDWVGGGLFSRRGGW